MNTRNKLKMGDCMTAREIFESKIDSIRLLLKKISTEVDLLEERVNPEMIKCGDVFYVLDIESQLEGIGNK